MARLDGSFDYNTWPDPVLLYTACIHYLIDIYDFHRIWIMESSTTFKRTTGIAGLSAGIPVAVPAEGGFGGFLDIFF